MLTALSHPLGRCEIDRTVATAMGDGRIRLARYDYKRDVYERVDVLVPDTFEVQVCEPA